MNINIKLKELQSKMKIEPERISVFLENYIKEYMEKLERESVVLGLSGGLDSAVVAALCKRAVGSKKTLALIMPDKDSDKEHLKDAQDIAEVLNIETKLVDISPYLKKLSIYKLLPLNKVHIPGELKGFLIKRAYNFYKEKTGETPFSTSVLGFKDNKFGSYLKKANAYYRIKHRLRMTLLYLQGELENRLIVGAANKSEYKIGFFVKHGCDDAADIMPLLNLYKTQVRELAKYLEIPSRIIEKSPSPDILPGITDEKAIGIPYEKLDLILLALEEGWEILDIVCFLGIKERDIIYIKNLIQKSEHMRNVYTPGNKLPF
jgi:NAD+ synthase